MMQSDRHTDRYTDRQTKIVAAQYQTAGDSIVAQKDMV